MKVKSGLVEIRTLEREGAIVEIQDGNHGEKHPNATDYVEDGIPFIMANNIIGNTIDTEGAAKLPSSIADGLRIGFAKNGDVLLTHKGTIGNTAIVDTSLPYLMLTPQVTYYRTDPKKLINRYLMYAFQEPLFQKTMASLAQQGTRPYIGITAQRNLKIRWKRLEDQQRVVAHLAPLDNLIENNRRRIHLLKESARLLYKEWFVYLRFPGHEHVKVVDGVPEGWEKKPLSELTDYLSRGITPLYDDEVNGVVINQKCIRNGQIDVSLARRQSKEFAPVRQLLVGDVLINSTGEGTLGRVAQVKSPIPNCTVDTHVTIVRPKAELGIHYFGMSLIALEPLFSTMGRGATNQTELSRAAIGEITILVPAYSLIRDFNEYVHPTYQQISTITIQNQKLKQARDLLLPRLMNGEIEV